MAEDVLASQCPSHRPSQAPGCSSSAPLSRQFLWLPAHFIPPRWPFAVGAVAVVAAVAGLVGAHLTAPVGNLVSMEVDGVDGVGPQALAARAMQAELHTQLRAMKLDVEPPTPGHHPAVRIRVQPVLHMSDGPQPRAVVAADLDVVVVDDAAGGLSRVSAPGVGATLAEAAMEAGTHAAWFAAGHVAALVAPQSGKRSMLRRVTDGRGPLRVFARARADMLERRSFALEQSVAARRRLDPQVTVMSAPGTFTRLLAPLDDARAVVSVTPRTPALLATARRDPRVVEDMDEVRVLPEDRLLMRAWQVLPPAAVSDDGNALAVVARGADGTVEVHLLDPTAPPGTAHVRAPLPDAEDARVLSVAAGTAETVLQTRRCFSNCAWETWNWRPPALPQPVPGAAEQTPEDVQDGSLPPGAQWHAQTVDGAWVALAAAPAPLHGQRLYVRAPHHWVFGVVTLGFSDERNAMLAPTGHAVFYEAWYPDPDLRGFWSELRRFVPRPLPR